MNLGQTMKKENRTINVKASLLEHCCDLDFFEIQGVEMPNGDTTPTRLGLHLVGHDTLVYGNTKEELIEQAYYDFFCRGEQAPVIPVGVNLVNI
jgi:hypothetical protein